MAPPIPTAWLGDLHPARLAARWRRRDLRLDPELLPRPLPGLGPRDFVITGCQRTGTSLAAAALFQPPHVVTLVEPWDGMRLPPDQLWRRWRDRIATGTLSGGTLDFDALRDSGKVRRVPEGTSSVTLQAHPDVAVGIKWPTFFHYLDLLPDTRFIVCLRHPFEVLGSMERLEGSRVAVGLDYDIPFNQGMNRALRLRHSDPALRRIELFDWIHERLARHLDRPNVFVLRYEDWWTRKDALLADLSAFLGVPLDACPVAIRPQDEQLDLSPASRALILRHSRMAHRLGYPLTEESPHHG